MLDLRLYLVTDRPLSMGRDIEWIVEEAVKGGVTMVQLREKECTTREFIDLAFRLKKILTTYCVPLIINDRLDVALAVDADGLHIGQNDMPYKMVRRLLGKDKVIGLSVENLEQAREANRLDVDYIGVSPVFTTGSKTDIGVPFGLEGLQEVLTFTRHPAVAIGGVNLSNAGELMQTGVHGMAVVSAICSAVDPQQAARDLSRWIQK